MLEDRLANKIAVGWYLAPYASRGTVCYNFGAQVMLEDRLMNKIAVGWYLAPYASRTSLCYKLNLAIS